MAKRTIPANVDKILRTYVVVSADVTDELGPHRVQVEENGKRTVSITAAQAQYYLDQGVIRPQ